MWKWDEYRVDLMRKVDILYGRRIDENSVNDLPTGQACWAPPMELLPEQRVQDSVPRDPTGSLDLTIPRGPAI